MKVVNATDYTGNASYYGMFAPSGLQSMGKQTGISLFSNATLPFMVASSMIESTELCVPLHHQAYGFNILLLINESTAMLDMPQPDYISTVQSLLAPGKSWTLPASVIRTVSKFNKSRTTDPEDYNSYLMDNSEAAKASSGAYTQMVMLDHHVLVLVGRTAPTSSIMSNSTKLLGSHAAVKNDNLAYS